MTKAMSLTAFQEQFPTEASAVAHFEAMRWPDGPRCPMCKSPNVASVKSAKPLPYRCRACREYFSVKTRTVMQSSKIGVKTWLLAIYFMSVAKKGVSSLQMSRQLGVRQATAWFMCHRIREAWNQGRFILDGEVEMDETYMGGKEKNKHAAQKLHAGRGGVGKTIVAHFATEALEAGAVAELVAALREVEFVTDGHYDGYSCPACGGGRSAGHRQGCRLEAALRAVADQGGAA